MRAGLLRDRPGSAAASVLERLRRHLHVHDRVRRQLEPQLGAALKQLGAEGAPDAGQERAERGGGVARHAGGPQRAHQLVARDGPVPVQDEEGEQRPAQPAGEAALHARAADLEPDLAPQLDRDRPLIFVRLGQFADNRPLVVETIVDPLGDLVARRLTHAARRGGRVPGRAARGVRRAARARRARLRAGRPQLSLADGRLRARRPRARGGGLRRARLRPDVGVRSGPRGGRAHPDPVPRRARGGGGGAPAGLAPAAPEPRAGDAAHRRARGR